MVSCKKCGFENYDGTKFCQRCGEGLPCKRSMNLNGIAGMGMKGVSIAPLVAGAVEEQSKKEFKNSVKGSKHVKTVPLEDGSWYCPDCGHHNNSFSIFCSGCGRDK